MRCSDRIGNDGMSIIMNEESYLIKTITKKELDWKCDEREPIIGRCAGKKNVGKESDM